MSSQNTKEQFVKQLETINEGLKQNLSKVHLILIRFFNRIFCFIFFFLKIESKKLEHKANCDYLNDKYTGLLDEKRIYYKTLKDFQEVKSFSCPIHISM
jgi:hypothetical protein